MNWGEKMEKKLPNIYANKITKELKNNEIKKK